jgi:methyltransferase family protein
MNGSMSRRKGEVRGRREKILDGLDVRRLLGIEIGPLCRPIVFKREANVIYVDHADTDELRQKYASQPTVDINQLVEIDAVWGRATLQEAVGLNVRADYIVASHVIEHVPDLITWLQELHSVLRENGEVRLAVPDRRFTFDYLRRESHLSDALTAYVLRARIPTPFAILDHFLNFREVDNIKAWEGTLQLCQAPTKEAFQGALRLAHQALEGAYCDAHCWVFTPRSFAQLFEIACRFGLINFTCEDFYDTEPNEIEFFVHLRKSADQSEMVESWHRMAEAASAEPTAARSKQTDLVSGDWQFWGNREQLKAELERAQHQISALQNSTSWKITRPLRAIVDTFRSDN